MKSIHRVVLAIAIVLTFAGSVQAAPYIGAWGGGKYEIAEGSQGARDLERAFLSTGLFQTEGFEGLEYGTSGSFKVGFGSIFSGGYVSDNTGMQIGTGEYPVDSEHFFTDGDLSGLQPKHDISMTINAPVTKFGMYATDLMDIGGKVSLTLRNSQSSEAYTLNLFDIFKGVVPDSLVYLAINTSFVFDDVSISTTAGDGFGIDNVSVGTSPTPIPGALWLLGSGLIGLVGVRRVKSVRKV